MEPKKKRKNEAVFVIFISKALHFNNFSACFIYFQLYSDGKRQKNATVALPVNATLGDNDGRGVGGGLGSHIVLQI